MPIKIKHIYCLAIFFAFLSNSFCQGEKLSGFYEVNDTDVYYTFKSLEQDSAGNLKMPTDYKNSKDWINGSITADFRNIINYQYVTLLLEIPDTNYKNPALLITSFLSEIEVFHGGVKIYEKALSENGAIDYYKPILIKISDFNSKSKILLIRLHLKEMIFTFSQTLIYYGTAEELNQKGLEGLLTIAKYETLELFYSGPLLLISIITFILFFQKKLRGEKAFLWFAIFTFIAGIYHLNNNLFYAYLDFPLKNHGLVDIFCLVIMSLPLFYFLETLYGSMWRNWLKKLRIINIVITAIFTLLLLISLLPFTGNFLLALIVAILIQHVISISILFLVFVMIKSGLLIRRDDRGIIYTMLFFIATSIHDLVFIEFGIVPWNFEIFIFGIFALIISFGFHLRKKFTILYQQTVLIENKLALKEKELLILQQENLESQFRALKNQVNPHFLFNTFSTLMHLIEENQQQAIVFVQELANVYRYVLQCKDLNQVKLSEELEFIRAYNYLLAKRFGENVQLIFTNIEPFMNTIIPPLTLQLLIENAIKHNIVSTKKPLIIEVYAKEEFFYIKNNLQKKNLVTTSTRIGLENIKKRYEYFTDKKIEIINGPVYFEVKLPILKDGV